MSSSSSPNPCQRRSHQRRSTGIRLCLAAALVCAAAAGGESETQPPPARGLARVAETSELRIGLSGEQPPLNMTAKNGKLIGMEVALARVLARSIGVEPIFVTLPFGQLLDALDAGRVDMVMSGMTITPARSRRVIFVGPYYTTGKALLTRSATLAAVELAEALDSADYTFVALEGSTSEDFVNRVAPEATLVVTPTLDEAIGKVLAGEVDALVADQETCGFATQRHPDAGLLVSEAVFTVEPMGIAVSKDDPRFANLIQTYMTALEDRGALEKVRNYWFENSEWVQDLR